MTSVVVMALCNQPEAYPSDLGDDQSRYLLLSICCCAGLNVYSMLKHETLVLTVPAVERIEERLLSHLHNVEFRAPSFSVDKNKYF